MSRITLQLPETLHRHLVSQAQREGVSLQQYILYALTRQLAHSYTVHVVSEEAVAQQPEQFGAVLEELPDHFACRVFPLGPRMGRGSTWACIWAHIWAAHRRAPRRSDRREPAAPSGPRRRALRVAAHHRR